MPSEPRFRGARLDESSVHRFGPWLKNVSKMVPKSVLNGGLDGPLGAKMVAGEAFITHAQTRHQTATKYSQKMTPKWGPKSYLVDDFRGLGPKASQSGPKDPPRHPPGSNLIQKGTKMETKMD